MRLAAMKVMPLWSQKAAGTRGAASRKLIVVRVRAPDHGKFFKKAVGGWRSQLPFLSFFLPRILGSWPQSILHGYLGFLHIAHYPKLWPPSFQNKSLSTLEISILA